MRGLNRVGPGSVGLGVGHSKGGNLCFFHVGFDRVDDRPPGIGILQLGLDRQLYILRRIAIGWCSVCGLPIEFAFGAHCRESFCDFLLDDVARVHKRQLFQWVYRAWSCFHHPAYPCALGCHEYAESDYNYDHDKRHKVNRWFLLHIGEIAKTAAHILSSAARRADFFMSVQGYPAIWAVVHITSPLTNQSTLNLPSSKALLSFPADACG